MGISSESTIVESSQPSDDNISVVANIQNSSGAGSRRAAAASGTNSQTDMPVSIPFHASFSAESTAERYYNLNFAHGSSSTRTMRINRGTDDLDSYAYPRNISTITVIEVEG